MLAAKPVGNNMRRVKFALARLREKLFTACHNLSAEIKCVLMKQNHNAQLLTFPDTVTTL